MKEGRGLKRACESLDCLARGVTGGNAGGRAVGCEVVYIYLMYTDGTSSIAQSRSKLGPVWFGGVLSGGRTGSAGGSPIRPSTASARA